MRESKTPDTVLFAILFLFLLQVLSGFIQSIYAFGLLVTAFTIQLAAILLLFTPLMLIALRKPPSRMWMIALAAVAILGRLTEPLLDPGGKLVASGISVGAFMLLFPLLLTSSRQRGVQKPHLLAVSLLIAVSLSIFLRTANSSLDLSESGPYQLLAWALALLAGWLIWRSQGFDFVAKESELSPAQGAARVTRAPTSRIVGLCIGLASVVLMLYFGLMSPTVIARWTGYSFAATIALLGVTLTIFAFLTSSRQWESDHAPFWSASVIKGWNALFIAMLVLTILPHQIAFPANANAYPIDAPVVSPWAVLPFFLMLILSPVIFIDFTLYVRQLSEDGPSIRQLGIGFALAAFFLLVMVFFHVFTTIYDYAPIVGPLFRDRFWLVYFLAGLGLGLPVLLVRWRKDQAPEEHRASSGISGRFIAAVVGALAILAIGAAGRIGKPNYATPSSGQLRIMTYNIQQGFDKIGNANLPGQLAVIRQVSPDLLGLQESDTARVANGNVDAVRYFADNLGMYSYYGPTTTTGTFGIALLSKYPIQNPHTFFMYSIGEQTAAIEAQIVADDKTYNVFVTHLGNNGELVQLQAVLKRTEGLPNVVLMGDFNFNPSTPQYALARTTLADAWLLRWPGGKDIPGLGSEGRIDQMFVSRGTSLLQSEYVVNPASDHPYLYAVVQP